MLWAWNVVLLNPGGPPTHGSPKLIHLPIMDEDVCTTAALARHPVHPEVTMK